MQTKPSGGSVLPLDSPACLLQYAQDMCAFNFFEGAGGGLAGEGAAKQSVVDLDQGPVRENRSPFDDVFQFPHITRPSISCELFYGSLGHPVEPLAKFCGELAHEMVY